MTFKSGLGHLGQLGQEDRKRVRELEKLAPQAPFHHLYTIGCLMSITDVGISQTVELTLSQTAVSNTLLSKRYVQQAGTVIYVHGPIQCMINSLN